MSRARSGKKIAIALGALAVLLLAGFVVTSWESILDWWYRIPVTRTWGDLLRTRPIELDGGLKIRLGIEQTRCPAGSGVLVYCLVDGSRPVEVDGDGDRLGPLRVRVKPIDRPEESRQLMDVRVRRGGYATKLDRHLFLRCVPIPRSGEYRVGVLDLDGSELRRVRVRGTDDAFHPWLTFGPPSDGSGLSGLGSVPTETIELRPSIAALPDWDGSLPLGDPETQGGIDRPETRLPGLWPDDSTPRLRVTAIPSGELQVVAPRPIHSTRVHSRLLARWWVGGRPFPAGVDELDAEPRQHMESWTGREITSARLRLDIRVDRTAVRAAPAERIELQLLYLERGWRLVGPELERLSQAYTPDESASLVSDRIELPPPPDG